MDSSIDSYREMVTIDKDTWDDLVNDYNELKENYNSTKNSLEFHPGDTLSYTCEINEIAYLSNSKKGIHFCFTLPKNIGSDVKKVTFSTVGFDIRHSGGGYIINSAADYSTNLASYFSVSSYSSNAIEFVHNSSTAYSLSNNIPLCITLRKLQIKFE